MLQVEKQRLFEKNIAKLVSDSFFDEDDMQKWIHAKDINCYAFARGLTYPDSKHEIYTPGKIYNLMYGTNKCIKNEYKPNLVHPYLVLDSNVHVYLLKVSMKMMATFILLLQTFILFTTKMTITCILYVKHLMVYGFISPTGFKMLNPLVGLTTVKLFKCIP